MIVTDLAGLLAYDLSQFLPTRRLADSGFTLRTFLESALGGFGVSFYSYGDSSRF